MGVAPLARRLRREAACVAADEPGREQRSADRHVALPLVWALARPPRRRLLSRHGRHHEWKVAVYVPLRRVLDIALDVVLGGVDQWHSGPIYAH